MDKSASGVWDILIRWSVLVKEKTIWRRAFVLLVSILISTKVVAPGANSLVVFDIPPERPFTPLVYAVGMVETMGDVLAFNELENAAGILQIRQVRIDEYNRRTGNHYSIADMFDYEISEKIFLYFASLIGPYDFERIAKAWNGSGPKTEYYWRRIKAFL